eukprot:jgi/Bigna1/80255/fgenesh1_pg.69_\
MRRKSLLPCARVSRRGFVVLASTVLAIVHLLHAQMSDTGLVDYEGNSFLFPSRLNPTSGGVENYNMLRAGATSTKHPSHPAAQPVINRSGSGSKSMKSRAPHIPEPRDSQRRTTLNTVPRETDRGASFAAATEANYEDDDDDDDSEPASDSTCPLSSSEKGIYNSLKNLKEKSGNVKNFQMCLETLSDVLTPTKLRWVYENLDIDADAGGGGGLAAHPDGSHYKTQAKNDGNLADAEKQCADENALSSSSNDDQDIEISIFSLHLNSFLKQRLVDDIEARAQLAIQKYKRGEQLDYFDIEALEETGRPVEDYLSPVPTDNKNTPAAAREVDKTSRSLLEIQDGSSSTSIKQQKLLSPIANASFSAAATAAEPAHYAPSSSSSSLANQALIDEMKARLFKLISANKSLIKNWQMHGFCVKLAKAELDETGNILDTAHQVRHFAIQKLGNWSKSMRANTINGEISLQGSVGQRMPRECCYAFQAEPQTAREYVIFPCCNNMLVQSSGIAAKKNYITDDIGFCAGLFSEDTAIEDAFTQLKNYLSLYNESYVKGQGGDEASATSTQPHLLEEGEIGFEGYDDGSDYDESPNQQEDLAFPAVREQRSEIAMYAPLPQTKATNSAVQGSAYMQTEPLGSRQHRGGRDYDGDDSRGRRERIGAGEDEEGRAIMTPYWKGDDRQAIVCTRAEEAGHGERASSQLMIPIPSPKLMMFDYSEPTPGLPASGSEMPSIPISQRACFVANNPALLLLRCTDVSFNRESDDEEAGENSRGRSVILDEVRKQLSALRSKVNELKLSRSGDGMRARNDQTLRGLYEPPSPQGPLYASSLPIESNRLPYQHAQAGHISQRDYQLSPPYPYQQQQQQQRVFGEYEQGGNILKPHKEVTTPVKHPAAPRIYEHAQTPPRRAGYSRICTLCYDSDARKENVFHEKAISDSQQLLSGHQETQYYQPSDYQQLHYGFSPFQQDNLPSDMYGGPSPTFSSADNQNSLRYDYVDKGGGNPQQESSFNDSVDIVRLRLENRFLSSSARTNLRPYMEYGDWVPLAVLMRMIGVELGDIGRVQAAVMSSKELELSHDGFRVRLESSASQSSGGASANADGPPSLSQGPE